MIRGLWWKLLSLALLLYVVLAGMLVPLKPGVTSVRPVRAESGGEVTLTVTTYNTRLDEAGDGAVRAWLRIGRPGGAGRADTAVAAARVEVLDAQTAAVTFRLPAYLPSAAGTADASLVLASPRDGASALPRAVAIVQAPGPAGPPDPGGWDAAIAGLSEVDRMTYPYRGLLGETIRNQYFHVSLWFALMLLMLVAAVYAGLNLWRGDAEYDRRSEAITRAGLTFGLLGLATGMVWANYTWGSPWNGDIKQEMTAVALLIYAAYFVLRGSLRGEQQVARLGSAYNVFAFLMLVPLLYVIPRMRDSLHPGAGGNPGFGGEDLDATMRMVFYPGIVGFTLLGLWIAQLWWRVSRLRAGRLH